MLIIMVVLGIVGLATVITATVLIVRAWLRSSDVISEHVRIELERRAAERELQQLAHAAMQRLLDEARRHRQ